MKKRIALLLILAIATCSFSGCSKKSADANTGSDTPENPTTQQDSTTQSDKLDYSSVKIGMLFDNTITAQGWHAEQADSMNRLKQDLQLKDDQVIMVENIMAGTPDVDSSIIQLVDEGCTLIIGTSSGYVTSFDSAAAKYPDTHFLEFEGGKADNYASYTMWDIDAIFMLGYGAALMSKSDTLGYIAPFPQASVVRSVNAWAAGAKAANPNCTVKLLWCNSWFDPAAEKECANGLINSGITCIGYYGSTTAVASACEEAGCYCTGFAAELSSYAPNAVLNTFEWNWTPIYREAVDELVSGKWNSDIKVAGTKEDAARIRDWNTAIMSQDIIDKCDEMYQKIKDGNYTVLEGPVKDNQGNEVLAKGKTFTLDELTNTSYLLDNVIGTLS